VLDTAVDSGTDSDSAPSVVPCIDNADPILEGAETVCDGFDDDGDGLVDEACHCAPHGELLLAEADAVLTVSASSSNQGYVSLGDVDGDGSVEFLAAISGTCASAPCSEGVIDVVDAPPGPYWQQSDGTVASLVSTAFAAIGAAPDLGGDFDGDGFADLTWTDADTQAWVLPGPLVGSFDGSTTDRVVVAPIDEGVHVARWIGDADGEPGDDLAFGAPGYHEYELGEFIGKGRVYVFSGMRSGALGTGDADGMITGVGADMFLGYHVAGVGDIDGDGIDDVSADGRLIALGPIRGEIEADEADMFLYDSEYGGAATDSRLLVAAAVGDVDGDGRDDAALGGKIGKKGDTVRRGAVIVTVADLGHWYAENMPRRLEISAEATTAELGWALAAGDFDGDDLGDLAVGGQGNEPGEAVFIEYGPFDGVRELGSGAVVVADDTTRVAGGGWWGLEAADTNGDGFDDLAIAAWPASVRGTVFAFLVLGGPRFVEAGP
jgi:hypothetical protein